MGWSYSGEGDPTASPPAFWIDRIRARTDPLRDEAGRLPWYDKDLDRVLFCDVPLAVQVLCRDDCDTETAERAADLICQLLWDTHAIPYHGGGPYPEIMTKEQLKLLLPLAERYADPTWVNREAARRALEAVYVPPPWKPTDVSDEARRLSHPD
jgi:hypothetical protein